MVDVRRGVPFPAGIGVMCGVGSIGDVMVAVGVDVYAVVVVVVGIAGGVVCGVVVGVGFGFDDVDVCWCSCCW